MKFGITPPYRANVASDPEWMTYFVRNAESTGFDTVSVVEHVAVPAGFAEEYPYSKTGRWPLPTDCEIPDPLELLSFLAARTERIGLSTGILIASVHHPLMLAKRLATIDVLSGGRMRLGVGVGWMREELDALDVEFSSRGRRLDERQHVNAEDDDAARGDPALLPAIGLDLEILVVCRAADCRHDIAGRKLGHGFAARRILQRRAIQPDDGHLAIVHAALRHNRQRIERQWRDHDSGDQHHCEQPHEKPRFPSILHTTNIHHDTPAIYLCGAIAHHGLAYT